MTQEQNTMVEKNLKLVSSIARHYHNPFIEYDDLYSIGCIELINAVKTYKKKRGAFSTYATALIQNKFKTAIKKEKQEPYIGYEPNFYGEGFEESLELKDLISKIDKDLQPYFLGQKTQTQIAKELGVDQSTISRKVALEKKILKNELHR